MKDFLIKVYARYRIAVWLFTTLWVLYTAVGFLIAPSIVQRILRDKLSDTLHRQVTAEGVRVNPYTLSVTLQGLSITGKESAPLITAQRLYANAQLSSLPRRALVLKAIEVDDPQVHVVREGTQSFNFSDLIPPGSSPAATSTSDPLRVILGRLSLSNGRIIFEDRTTAPAFSTQWATIQFLLERLDSKAGSAPAEFLLTAAGESREQLKISGQAAAAPPTARADIQLDGVAIAHYSPYYQPFFKAQVTGGLFNLKATARWAQGKGRLDPIGFVCTDLHIDEATNQPLLAVGRFQVEHAAVDMDQRTIGLGDMTTRDGKLWISRDTEGRFNLLKLVARPDGAGRDSAPVPAKDPAWQAMISRFKLDNFSVSMTDLQPEKAAQVELNQIALTAENLNNRKNSPPGKLSLKGFWSGQGTFSTEGSLSLIPLAAELKIKATDLDLRPAQPYIHEHLQLTVTSGKIGTQGTLRIVTTADQTLDVQYTGQAALNDFQTVDSIKTRDFVAWKSLFLSGLEMGTRPLHLTIDQVSLTDFFKRLVVYPDGTTNLGSIFRGARKSTIRTGEEEKGTQAPTEGVPPAETATKEQPADIRINTVILQGGLIDFRDHYVKPNVRVTLNDVGGRISGLASTQEQKADVLLRGSTPSKIPFEISGKVNPLIEKPFLDLKMVFTGIDLSQYAPYSAKYLGYELDKGHLSLSLAYSLENNRLKGQNKVTVNQLTFGDAVQSPNATKLPVKLAVALLKDRQGNINLDLPVEGSVDDPQFSMGGIVLTMLGNLVIDIVSSPFKMLGAIFGGGEELQYLTFEAGSAEIPPAGADKLATLAKALNERPSLHLDIQGQVDPETDGEALRQARFERRLKAAKLKSMWRAVPMDQIQIKPQEKERLIKKAYKEADFPKPRDEKGHLKKIEPAEMEKLLVTAIEISTDTLRQLAYERAIQAKNHLVAQGGITADRLFVVEPEIGEDANPEQRKSQVQFKVK